MIEKISISDVNQNKKMQISLKSTPIKRKQSIQEGLASSDLDNEKGFIVAFEGTDALSETDKSVLKEVHSKLTPQAKSFIDEAYEFAKENGNKEIHQIHFQYLGLKKFKEYIELLNSGEIDFDNDDDYIDIAGVFQTTLNDEIIKKEEQRTKLLPAITEQMELLEDKFATLPKLGFFSKKPVLNKIFVKDLYQAFKQNTADNDGSEDFINEGDILSAAFNSSDNNINIDYTRPIIFAIQDSIMRDVLTEEDKAHIGMFDENAQKVLKNLGAKTNMFVLFEKGAKPVFMFNSIESALNSDEKFGSLTKDNSELIYLNKFANYQYLNTLINNLAKDKSKQHILLFNMDKMEDNPTIRTESLVDKLTEYIPENMKYVIFTEKDKFYGMDADTKKKYQDYGDISMPLLSLEQAKKAFKEEPLLMSKVKTQFTPEAIDAVIDVVDDLEGNYPEKAIKVMQKMGVHYVDKDKVTKEDVDEYVKTAKDIFKPKENKDSVEVVFDTKKTLKDMLGAQTTKKEIESIVNQIKNMTIGTKGFLIYPQDGYSGGGRRHSAQVIAGETKSPYVEINALDFGTKEVSIFDILGGNTVTPESAMKKVFSQIKSQAETTPYKSGVLFIENFEYFSLGDQVSDYHKKAMSQLLKEMEIAEKQDLNILVMGSLASGENIGESTLKSFKFVDKIEVESVDRNTPARQEIIQNYLDKNNIELEAVNDAEKAELLKMFAETTEGFPFVELMSLMNKTKNLIKERGHEKLSKADFVEAFLQVRTGRPSSVQTSEHRKRIVTSHECGHALNAFVMYNIAKKQNKPWHLPEKVNFITLDPRGIYGGAVFYKESENEEWSFNKVFADLVHAYGGHSCEKALYNQDGSWGITSDLEQATDKAYAAAGVMAQGVHYGKKSLNGAPYISEAAQEAVEKDVNVFTNNAVLASDLIVKTYKGFIEEFTQKYSKLVGTGECIIMSETFENELNNWKTSQTKAKQKEFEKLEAIILGIIALSKKGEIIDVAANLAKSKTNKANIAALKNKVMEFATSSKMIKRVVTRK
ncbi:AAA family ATPase [bacterium]|nr:AAA family ATPase [bacterium]